MDIYCFLAGIVKLFCFVHEEHKNANDVQGKSFFFNIIFYWSKPLITHPSRASNAVHSKDPKPKKNNSNLKQNYNLSLKYKNKKKPLETKTSSVHQPYVLWSSII
jgi:hypothetical protein